MRFHTALLTALLGAALAACGQKGPLYLPDAPPAGMRATKPPVPKPIPYPVRPGADAEKPD